MRKSKLVKKYSRWIYLIKKEALQLFKPYTEKKKILFIIGCQRSGTSLMSEIFEKDSNAKTFSEFSKLSSKDDHKIRLNPFPSVKEDLLKVRVPLLVLKPLVESQNALELLKGFDGSKALWMYRDYNDVASSNFKYFGINNSISDLRPIVENESGNWRSEKVSKNVREIITSHFSENMNLHDAAVLFWYARNSLYFELGLDHNPDVLICKYEDLVTNSERVVKTIYGNLKQTYPGSKIHKMIHTNSLKKGKSIKLSPEIEQLAKGLLGKLDKVYQANQL